MAAVARATGATIAQSREGFRGRTRSQTTETVPATDEEPAGQRWKPAVNGDCPNGYPLKANDNSGIFHLPGGRFYERTVAERCYANADDAIADGYRPAKA